MIKRKLTKLAPFFRSVGVVFLASLFVMSIVYAATTIGSNINTGGTLDVTGETHMAGPLFATSTIYFDNATSTGDLAIGGNATTSGNLSIGGFASTTGYLKVGGGVIDLATSTGATTTPGIFSRDETTSTSTISIGDIFDGVTKKQVGCLEMAATDGAYYRCYIDTAVAASAALICEAGRCN